MRILFKSVQQNTDPEYRLKRRQIFTRGNKKRQQHTMMRTTHSHNMQSNNPYMKEMPIAPKCNNKQQRPIMYIYARRNIFIFFTLSSLSLSALALRRFKFKRATDNVARIEKKMRI